MFREYGEVYENCSLEKYNTYNIKTSCTYLVKPNSIENLLLLLKAIEKEEYNYFIIGGGSNLILPDSKFDGVIISLEYLNKVIINDKEVIAEAGIRLNNLIKLCIDSSLSGFEYLFGIPGTLGGALYGNAGVKDHTIYDNLINIEVIRNGRLVRLNKKDIEISYRYTSFKANNDIIIRATFNLNEGIPLNMNLIIKEINMKRITSQPLEYPNAGSVFKNPLNNYAGRLIEDAGLKGYSVGDAEVSNKHANFIINKGHATSKDIKDLINIIQTKVYEKYKISLELEQIIVEWD